VADTKFAQDFPKVPVQLGVDSVTGAALLQKEDGTLFSLRPDPQNGEERWYAWDDDKDTWRTYSLWAPEKSDSDGHLIDALNEFDKAFEENPNFYNEPNPFSEEANSVKYHEFEKEKARREREANPPTDSGAFLDLKVEAAEEAAREEKWDFSKTENPFRVYDQHEDWKKWEEGRALYLNSKRASDIGVNL